MLADQVAIENRMVFAGLEGQCGELFDLACAPEPEMYLAVARRKIAGAAGSPLLLSSSSGPELDPRVQMEAVRLLKLPPAARAKVLGGNILRLTG